MENMQAGNSEQLLTKKQLDNRYKYIIEFLQGATGDVLIIGSGDGSLERRLLCTNYDLYVTSLDINECFRENLDFYSETVIIDDFLKHNFRGEKFDYIISTETIEHVNETSKFLLKMQVLLRDENSICMLQTPNLASWHSRLCLLFGYMPEALECSERVGNFGKIKYLFRQDRANHIRVFTYGALCEAVKYSDFTIEKAYGVDIRIPFIFKYLPSIAGAIHLRMKRGK